MCARRRQLLEPPDAVRRLFDEGGVECEEGVYDAHQRVRHAEGEVAVGAREARALGRRGVGVAAPKAREERERARDVR